VARAKNSPRIVDRFRKLLVAAQHFKAERNKAPGVTRKLPTG